MGSLLLAAPRGGCCTTEGRAPLTGTQRTLKTPLDLPPRGKRLLEGEMASERMGQSLTGAPAEAERGGGCVGSQGFLCRAPALAQEPLTSGLLIAAPPPSLLAAAFLHRQRKQPVREQRLSSARVPWLLGTIALARGRSGTRGELCTGQSGHGPWLQGQTEGRCRGAGRVSCPAGDGDAPIALSHQGRQAFPQPRLVPKGGCVVCAAQRCPGPGPTFPAGFSLVEEP